MLNVADLIDKAHETPAVFARFLAQSIGVEMKLDGVVVAISDQDGVITRAKAFFGVDHDRISEYEYPDDEFPTAMRALFPNSSLEVVRHPFGTCQGL